MMATANGPPPATPPQSEGDATKASLQKRILHRQASLTEGESAFLRALLVDPLPKEKSEHSQQMKQAAKTLDDDILFSLPIIPPEGEQQLQHTKAPPKPKRRQTNWIGLWKAFEEGVRPRSLIKRASPLPKDTPPKEIVGPARRRTGTETTEPHRNPAGHRRTGTETTEIHRNLGDIFSEAVQEDDEDDSDYESIKSDEKILVDKSTKRSKDGGDESSASSWEDTEGGYEHFDAWAVLKDEYAQDFGFDYSFRSVSSLTDDDEEGHHFMILGTSADDKSAQPHVLSPPLMDSLMNFLPEGVSQQNWWLKYSLVRDGASLETFKRYVRGGKYTILAIETTSGDVFGAFTASSWRTSPRFYGSGEAFLWKMRYNRMTPCSSLFDQAQLESEIDVYVYSHLNRFVQLSTHDMLAIGGGELPENIPQDDKQDDSSTVETPMGSYIEFEEDTGFGIALTDDLLRGTSSPCATFRNPCLVHHHSSHGEPFEVMNLEAWTFTPCYDVDSAQKLEMTKFFIQESTRESMGSTDRSFASLGGDDSRCTSPKGDGYLSSSSSITSTRFTARDLIQKKFYRRVGEEDEDEAQRDRFAYANMMGGL